LRGAVVLGGRAGGRVKKGGGAASDAP